MKKLYFPNSGNGLQDTGRLQAARPGGRFYLKSEDLEQRAEQMMHNYSKNPDSVGRDDVVSLVLDTYRFTVELFEDKISRGESLLPEERAIYELCRQEIQKTSVKEHGLQSIYGSLFYAIELVGNCITQVKDWFNLSSEKDKADMCLVRAGDAVLPGYAGVVGGFFTTVAEFFVQTFTPTVIGVAEAQAECALLYQEARTVDKPLAAAMLDIADYAYSGHPDSRTGEYRKLSAAELPASIRVLYDEQKGLLTSTKGLQVWIGKKDDHLVVSYSGTDIKNPDMIYADILQLSAPSILYLKAAGLLKLLLDHIPGKSFYVTGHSLGGGLTQFSLTANMDMYRDRLWGYGYNPAGLSMVSLRYLKTSRLRQACKKTWIFMTCYDPVSSAGGKIGCLTTLPKTDKNGHGMADLKVCMKKYLEETPPGPSANRKIVWKNHEDADFIPYTRKLSFADMNGTVYPVFNDHVSSDSEDFITVNIPDALFSSLGLSTKPSDCCLGVYNKFNGTAHTVLNRLLLLADGEPVVTTNSIGNIHSSIIYGKFGLGMKEFIPMLEKAYADSGEAYAGSRSAYEKVLASLNNPFAYDKDAWCAGIRIQFGIDMEDIFSRWPLAESFFDTFLTKITSDRIDIYRSVYTKTPPDQNQIRSFLSKLKEKVLQHAGELMDEAVRWNVITTKEKADYEESIEAFCRQVLQNLG